MKKLFYVLFVCLFTSPCLAASFEETKKTVEIGDSEAEHYLGNNYDKEQQGIRMNIPEALKWFRKSAEQGNQMAQYGLGIIYWNSYANKYNSSN